MINTEKYKELFLSEATEHLDSIDGDLIKLEKDPSNIDLMKEIMRHSHTLKGIAAEMGYGQLSNLSHSFEGMVENQKNNLSNGGVEMLFGALDELRELVERVRTQDNFQPANPLVDEVGELQHVDKKKTIEHLTTPSTFKPISEVRVRVEKLDNIMNLVSELLVNKLRMENTILPGATKEARDILETHSRHIEELQYSTMDLRLTPIAQVFNRFPRMVRDLSKKQSKDISFTIEDNGIELDRAILDDLAEPLVHLLRNAIDHGIEKEGTLTLTAQRDKNSILIQIEDSGAGIPWEKVQQKAGVRTSDKEVLTRALFNGLSTSETVSEISGRGVGLSVVKEKLEQLGGSITLTSPLPKKDFGTQFTLRLPASLAIIQAILVAIRDEPFAIALNDIERLLRSRDHDILTQADQELVVVGGGEIPLIRLSALFGLESEHQQRTDEMIVVIQHNDQFIGLVVDAVDRQLDIVVKPLDKKLRDIGFFSGVTILGDGNPVAILDVDAIVKRISHPR